MKGPPSVRAFRDGRELERIEVDLLLEGIARRYGYDFRHYSRPSLLRRLRGVMAREGVSTFSTLQERLLHDPGAMLRMVEDISVHTTSMFRDAEFFLGIREKVVPLLRTYPFVRIWLAGCATGEEAYSLAILLEEEGVYDRCRIYATDLSDAVLTKARAGIYSLAQMREYTYAYQRAGGRQDFSSYFQADGTHAIFRQSLRRNMIFSQHNLASDSAFNEFQLILCRNVTIYFDEVLRNRALELIFESLGKFGVLGLGAKESLRFSLYEKYFHALVEGTGLYRRIA